MVCSSIPFEQKKKKKHFVHDEGASYSETIAGLIHFCPREEEHHLPPSFQKDELERETRISHRCAIRILEETRYLRQAMACFLA